MTAPIRWKETSSEAGDELHAIMRYAHARRPNEAQLASLTAAVLAQLPPPTPLGKLARTWSAGKLTVWGLIVALGGGASVATYFAGADKPRPSHAIPTPVVQPAPAVVIEQPPPIEPAEVPVVSSPERPRELRHQAIKHPVSAAAIEPEGEVELLQAARSARVAAPERALHLLSEHARRYPDSMFNEEREALWIEILQHTNPSQAARRLREFNERFPQSVYQQRIGDAGRAR